MKWRTANSLAVSGKNRKEDCIKNLIFPGFSHANNADQPWGSPSCFWWLESNLLCFFKIRGQGSAIYTQVLETLLWLLPLQLSAHKTPQMPGVQNTLKAFPACPHLCRLLYVTGGLLSWLNPSCGWCLEREVRPGCWSKDHKMRADDLNRTYPEPGNPNSSLGLSLIYCLLDVKIMVGTKLRFNIWCLATKRSRNILFGITLDRKKCSYIEH